MRCLLNAEDAGSTEILEILALFGSLPTCVPVLIGMETTAACDEIAIDGGEDLKVIFLIDLHVDC